MPRTLCSTLSWLTVFVQTPNHIPYYVLSLPSRFHAAYSETADRADPESAHAAGGRPPLWSRLRECRLPPERNYHVVQRQTAVTSNEGKIIVIRYNPHPACTQTHIRPIHSGIYYTIAYLHCMLSSLYAMHVRHRAQFVVGSVLLHNVIQ